MATIENRFYLSEPVSDVPGGSDVRSLTEASVTTPNTSIARHPNSGGTTSITYDPFTTRTTQGDQRSSYGWAINKALMDSKSDAKRIILAGNWQYVASFTNGGSNSLGSSSCYLTAQVFRVSSGGTRTLMFSFNNTGAISNGLLGASASGSAGSTVAQPEFILEAGETIHFGLQNVHTQNAGILGGTVQPDNNLNLGIGTWIQVPGDGIRTQYFRTRDAEGESVTTQLPKGVGKGAIQADGESVGTQEREWQAYRYQDAEGESVGTQEREWQAYRYQDAEGESVGTQEREWQAYRYQDAEGEGSATNERLWIAYRNPQATGEATGEVERSWVAFRNPQATGESVGNLGRIVTFVRTFLSDNEGVPTQQPKYIIKDGYFAGGEGISTQHPKFVIKDEYEAVGEGISTQHPKFVIKDEYEAVGEGVPNMQRIVTFVRLFDATGTGEISSFRLGLDADDLPDPGEGSGTTIVYKRPVILLVDD